MKKQVKSEEKPMLIVNLTDIETPEDIRYSFLYAKATQGFKLTKEEVEELVMFGVHLAAEIIDDAVAEQQKKVIWVVDDKIFKQVEKIFEKITNPKKPWYKRFWSWITKPFKKKK